MKNSEALPVSQFQRFANRLANMDPLFTDPDGKVSDVTYGPRAYATDPLGVDVIKVTYGQVLVTDDWTFMSLTVYLTYLQHRMEQQ